MIEFINASQATLSIGSCPAIDRSKSARVPEEDFWKWAEGPVGKTMIRKREIKLCASSKEHRARLEEIRRGFVAEKPADDTVDPGDPAKVPTHDQIRAEENPETLMAWLGLELSDKKRDAVMAQLKKVDPELADDDED